MWHIVPIVYRKPLLQHCATGLGMVKVVPIFDQDWNQLRLGVVNFEPDAPFPSLAPD